MNNKINNDGLVLELPVKFCMVTYMCFEQKCGEHAEIIIKGILDSSEKIKNAYAMNLKDTLILRKNGKIIFSGVPTYVSVNSQSGLMNVTVKGKSRSLLLDIKKEKQSFQKKQTYLALLKKVIGNDGILNMQETLKNKEKSQVVVQYKETDWDFIKRMASHMYVPVCPNISIEKTGVYVGFPKGNLIEEKVSTYQIKKNLSEYQKHQTQDTSVQEKDFITLMFQSRNYYKIGDYLTYDGNKYRIVYVKMDFKDSTLVFTYGLKHKNGIKWRKKYNSKLSGASINGKIIKVNRDSVKLHLSIDETQSVLDAAFFQVAIDYTAEGNTGLYSAMDEGERVKLFFPSADEKDAYVRCVDKNDSETSEHFSTPTTKSYGTPYGSALTVTEKGISISSVKDSIFINMNEEDGITFHSTEDIHIYTEKKVSMECKKLTISSKDRIILNTEGSNIIVDETMHFKTKG